MALKRVGIALRRRSVTLALAVSVAALGVAGCGSASDSSSTSSATTQSTTTAAASAATTAPAGPGRTITVGFFSPYGGALAVPQLQAGMEAALKAMNPTNSVKWKVDICDGDGTPQTDVACANRFVGDHVTAAFDDTDFGIEQAVPILVSAGIPIFGGFENFPQKAGTAAFYLAPSGVASINAVFIKLKEEGAKKITIMVADITTWHDYVKSFLQPEADKLGIHVTVLFYDPSSPNFTTEAAAMTATHPDAEGVITLATESACLTVYQAIRTSCYTGPVVMGNCEAFASKLGSQAAGAVISTDVWLPGMAQYAPPAMQARLKEAQQELAGDTGGGGPSYWTYQSYSDTRTAGEIIDAIPGPVSRAAITKQFEAVNDYPSWLGSTMTCDGKQSPSDVQSCGTAMLVATVQKDGTIKPDGPFLSPGG
jgi:branched-chain amino acid transport system substrate-binding protein